jgi:hypothetical protein
MRQPVRCPRTGLWLALHGRGRRHAAGGRYKRRRDAQLAIAQATRAAEVAAAVAGRGPPVTFREFFETWPERSRGTRGRSTRTSAGSSSTSCRTSRTGATSARAPQAGDAARAHGQAHLPRSVEGHDRQRLRDGVGDAERRGRRRGDRSESRPRAPRQAQRPAAAADEAGAGPARRAARRGRRLHGVPAASLAADVLAPFLTGARPGELFAMKAEEIDAERSLIHLHETADRYGRLERGRKTTHHALDSSGCRSSA